MKVTKQERAEILRIKIRKLMEVQGNAGLPIKMSLLGGLRSEELLFAYCQEVCDNAVGCPCKKLHVIDRLDGLSILYIDWLRPGKRVYFSIEPTRLWQRFRDQPTFGRSDIIAANKAAIKAAGVGLAELRQINHAILQSTMDGSRMAVLAGKADPPTARLCYDDIGQMTKRYCDGWQRFGVILVPF